MRVFFHTLGCKVNQYETEYMRSSLKTVGFEDAENITDADIIVINSCTVTAESDRKTRQLARRYRRLNEDAIIILTGCMPQAFPQEAEKLPADIVLGNGSSRDIVSAVDRFLKSRQRLIDIAPHQKGESFEKCKITTFSERTRAYMKIEDGCDRGCTYCIIPKARGRVRSRSLEDVKNEAELLARNGFLEIVLVGINLSSFGKDTGHTLADAVLAVSQVEGIERIRLGSLEPDLTDQAFLDSLKEIDKFCPQFHLSLQSGSDATLKRMNRLYTTAQYKAIVKNIRSRWPNSGITTDIMVGFIGETEKEFSESVNFAKEIGFVKAHIFPYSIRKGTAAETMTGRVDEQIKAKRTEEMARVCEERSKEIFENLKGTTCKVLFESYIDGYLVGYSESYVPVFVKGDKAFLHTLATVKINKTYKDGVLGEII